MPISIPVEKIIEKLKHVDENENDLEEIKFIELDTLKAM